MSCFIELVTDAFQETFNAQSKLSKQTRRAGTDNARRPLRGLEVKDDTYAIIKVVTASGEEIPLIDSGSESGTSTQYTNFILQSVQEARMEKHQIVETFGDPYIFFFGESPRFLDVSAVLVDSNDFNWYAEFWENYNNYLRGTKSVELGARTYLFYDDNIVEGYMLNATAMKQSDAPLMARLQFRLYLTNYSNISFVGDPNFPVRGSIILPSSVTDINTVGTDQGALGAVLGANLQNDGFGGGDKLADALRGGLDPGSLSPGLQGVLTNAAEAFFGTGAVEAGSQRALPLRSLIADNRDEYTGAPPELQVFQNDTDVEREKQLFEAENLAFQVLNALVAHGAQAGSHDALMSMGLGPRFGTPGIGIGAGAGVGTSATFGARSGFGISSGATAGIGGGLGFGGSVLGDSGFGSSNGFGPGQPKSVGSVASIARGSKTGDLLNQLNAASFKDLIDDEFVSDFGNYQNGVPLGLGITSNTGVGGGISGGISSTTAATVSFGVTSRDDANRAGRPVSPPFTGGGANVTVGGTPSAFSLTSVGGTLDANGFNANSSSFSGQGF